MISSNPIDLINSTNEQVGKFSRYLTTEGPMSSVKTRPAEGFLNALGLKPLVEGEPAPPLSSISEGLSIGEDGVTIEGLPNNPNPKKLTLTKECIEGLRKSAKVYVNTDIFRKGFYKETQTKDFPPVTRDSRDPVTGEFLVNMATAICHVQQIHLLVEQKINDKDEAIASHKAGIIEKNTPAPLLLSSPAINCGFGSRGKGLSEEKLAPYISAMYRNLFKVALLEGCTYITMPAAGLGIFRGDPKLYFKILTTTALAFPELNIIYNPAQFTEQFQEALAASNVKNVFYSDKDIVFFANELTKNGARCAIHNPSDYNVVYGNADVGCHWRKGHGPAFLGEENIGAMSTAALNSKGLNEKSYQEIIELEFSPLNPNVLIENQKPMPLTQSIFSQSKGPNLKEKKEGISTNINLDEERAEKKLNLFDI